MPPRSKPELAATNNKNLNFYSSSESSSCIINKLYAMKKVREEISRLPEGYWHITITSSQCQDSAAEFWSSRSFIWRSACSLSQALIPMMISIMVPVVPKNTRGANDFRFIPTGIASNAPATENTHVPRALHFPHITS